MPISCNVWPWALFAVIPKHSPIMENWCRCIWSWNTLLVGATEILGIKSRIPAWTPISTAATMIWLCKLVTMYRLWSQCPFAGSKFLRGNIGQTGVRSWRHPWHASGIKELIRVLVGLSELGYSVCLPGTSLMRMSFTCATPSFIGQKEWFMSTAMQSLHRLEWCQVVEHMETELGLGLSLEHKVLIGVDLRRDQALCLLIATRPSPTSSRCWMKHPKPPTISCTRMFCKSFITWTCSQSAEVFNQVATISGLPPLHTTGRICHQLPATIVVMPPNSWLSSLMSLKVWSIAS